MHTFNYLYPPTAPLMYFSLTGKGQQKAMFVRMSFLSPDGTSHRPIVFSRACGSALAFPQREKLP